MAMAMTSFKMKPIGWNQADNYCLMDARKALKKIFREDDLCEGDDSPACRRALSLLSLHPQLAREWYEATEEDVSFRFLPLSIFVASGASLEVIETVHDLYPDAISTKHPDLKLYPLQAACEVHADDDVISFLASTYPEAVETRDYKGDLAIHSVLNQGKEQLPRRKTVEMLLDIYPQSVEQVNADQACPLVVAFLNEQSPKIIEKIIQKRKERGLDSFSLVGCPELEARDVSRLSLELLPRLKLKSFRCEPQGYTKEGFLYLMESLAADETIEKLTMGFPPLGGGRSEAFLDFLKQNHTVQHLTLSRDLNMWSRGSGVDSLLQGLDSNDSLKTLRVSGLFLLSSFEVGFLVSRAPPKLVLNTIMLETRWRGSNHKQWGSSKVEELKIRNCKMRGGTLDRILEALPLLPKLKRLTLDFANPEDKHDVEHLRNRDVTKPVIALLKKGNLEELILHGLNIDVRKLSVKLHKNKKLKKLHLDAIRNCISMNVGCLVGSFIKGNTTLEEVKFHCDYDYDNKVPDGDGQTRPSFQYVEDPAINYYTSLNRSGKQASLLHTVMSMPDGKAKDAIVAKSGKESSLLHKIMSS